MKPRCASPLGLIILFTLSACGDPQTIERADNTSEVEEFAARINGGNAVQPQASQTPSIAPPRSSPPLVAPTPIPAPSQPIGTCGADRMAQFIGKIADDATRADVLATVGGVREVRFISAGSEYDLAKSANPQFILILDAQGIIRDARCG